MKLNLNLILAKKNQNTQTRRAAASIEWMLPVMCE